MTDKMMRAVYDIPHSRSARLARHLASFSALLFAVSALSHRYGLLETPGFVAVLAATGALALVALVVAAVGFRSVWRDGDTGGRDIAFGALVAIVVLAPFGLAAAEAIRLPMLHDISTDTDNPPELGAPLTPLPGANSPAAFDAATAQRQQDGYPEIVGRRYSAAPDRVEAAVESLVESRRWTILPQDDQTGSAVTIQAEGVTRVLGFPFAVSIRIGDEGDTTVVDMRSASRYGRHDFGDNARRVNAFLNDLDAEIAKQAGT